MIPYEKAKTLLIGDMEKSLSKKDHQVIVNNTAGIELAEKSMTDCPIPAAWAELPFIPASRPPQYPTTPQPHSEMRERYMRTMEAVVKLEGDTIPVSAFAPGGLVPTGTSFADKRGSALNIPQVDMKKCIQCNKCSLICPHAAIRPFLMTPEECESAPEVVRTSALPAQGQTLSKYKFRVQVSPLDCTGCELCSRMCPTGALKMSDAVKAIEEERPNWDYVVQLPNRGKEIDLTTIRGSQFQQPLLEFSGACEGCGETPYVKLLTQLFGSRLVIANASGCSIVWAGWTPSMAYTVDGNGEGPAWGTSLFEDNAEYGLGMRKAHVHRRKQFLDTVEACLKDPSLPVSEPLRRALSAYVTLAHECEHDVLLKFGKSVFREIYDKVVPLLREEKDKDPRLAELYDTREFFTRVSHWILGGDGWAYDIGFGGLDHVLNMGEHTKVMVLDTQVYSNTGGQASKATPMGAQVKFAEDGKGTPQKDLGQYGMSMKNIYVASVCLHANPEQTLRALLEAEQYPGPALVICYCPCIAHGFKMSDSITHCHQAVESGFWPLYRYNPELAQSGNNPFQLDGKKLKADLMPLLKEENRFTSVMRSDPTRAKALDSKLQQYVSVRHTAFRTVEQISSSEPTAAEKPGNRVVILYGSESGHAEEQARVLRRDLTGRGSKVQLEALDDFDFETLPSVEQLIVVISTCGLGEFPHNSRKFWKTLQDPGLSMALLSNVKYTVFGLGDSNYSAFCATAAAIDVRLGELGAQRVLPRGVGDDQDPERYFSGWEAWTKRLWPALKLPELPTVKQPPPYIVQMRTGGAVPAVTNLSQLAPSGTCVVKHNVCKLLTPNADNRTIHHHEFDIRGSGLTYRCGDSLSVNARNPEHRVKEMLGLFGWKGTEELTVRPAEGTRVPDSATAERGTALLLGRRLAGQADEALLRGCHPVCSGCG